MLTRMLHLLAVGLWFGSAVFFTFVVGLSLFDTFKKWSSLERDQRPLWLPLPPELDRDPPSSQFPDPLRQEQGSRVAGAAVGPMFKWYYGTQIACGVIALLTALTWGTSGKLPRFRLIVLTLALAGAGAGWWLEKEVEARRVVRSETSDTVLKNSAPSAKEVQAADTARIEFGRWHTYSLGVNMLTVALVTVAMALAARLPPSG